MSIRFFHVNKFVERKLKNTERHAFSLNPTAYMKFFFSMSRYTRMYKTLTHDIGLDGLVDKVVNFEAADRPAGAGSNRDKGNCLRVV